VETRLTGVGTWCTNGGARTRNALAWIQLLREAVQELEYQAVFTDAEYEALTSQ
jgi:hypothetical protein